MIVSLEKQDYDRVRSLFAGLEAFNVSIGGVFEGWCPGAVFADDARDPSAAFIYTPEGSYLAGDPGNAAFHHAFPGFVTEELFGKRGWQTMYLQAEGGWEAILPDILPRQPAITPRRHYECRALALDWRAAVPEGYSVHRIDPALIARYRLDQVRGEHSWMHIHYWMVNGWGTVGDFLQNGFGIVTVYQDEVVSWSLADCRAGDHCEIGIHTAPDYRRRGLAAITAAAAVEHALSNGYAAVGWHCNEDNPGSFRTAEKVGFKLERRYTTFICYARAEAPQRGTES